jgi:hypothetical protein
MKRRVYPVVAVPVNGLFARLFHNMPQDFDNNRRLLGGHFSGAITPTIYSSESSA